MYLHPVEVLTSDRSVKLHFTPQHTPSHLDCKDNPSDQGGVVLNDEYQTIIYLLPSCLYQSVGQHFSPYTLGLWVRAGKSWVWDEGRGGGGQDNQYVWLGRWVSRVWLGRSVG